MATAKIKKYYEDDTLIISDKGFLPSKLSDLADDSTHRTVTDTEKGTWNAKEDASNKSNDIATDGSSTTKYPSVKAIKDYADSLVIGLTDLRGEYNASVNTFPATGGSGTGGAILKGDVWLISVEGTLGGVLHKVGDAIMAIIDTPGQTAGNWGHLNNGLGYVAENTANKVTSISSGSTDIQYPSAKLLYDQLGLKQDSSAGLTSLAGLTFASTSFVKMTGANTYGLDTNTYLTSLSGAVLTDQTTPQTIGDTTNRLLKLWATDITCTNAIDGSVTGNAGTVTNGVYTTGADSVYLTPGTASTTYLKLDQTSPQTVINGRPVFNVGLTANDDIYGTNINYNEGLLDDPTIIDADGVAINVSSVDCLIRSSSTWDGDKKLYKKTVPANETLAVTDNSINYIYVTWNSGTPIYAATTDRGVLNNSDALPVARVYMSGGNIEYQLLYEYIGRSAAIRNFDRVMRIRGSSGIERESGFGLSETATRVINIEAGSAWFGLRRITSSTLGAIAQGGAGVTSHLWYHSGGVWTSSSITAYNNTQYDNGTNLATLTANRYAVNWVFRSIVNDEIDVVLGRGDYTLAQAEASTIPPLPEAISNFYVLCGRIIVQKSSDTAYAIQNVSTSTFNQATVSSHPNLSGLAWTTAGHTGTASTIAGFLASTGVAAEYTLGIANNNIAPIDDASVSDNDYAKFTANGLEGVPYATVLSDIGAAATGQTFYIGTTQVAINRASAALTLAGITLTTPNIGTPSAGTLTNCTGLPIAGLTASTSTALGVGSIELGHASDTTISRVSAGVVAIEGSNIMTVGSTDTVTGTKTFDSTKLEIKGSSTGKTAIASANSSSTSYTATLPAKDGTIAMTSDITSDLSIKITPLQGFGSSNITAGNVNYIVTHAYADNAQAIGNYSCFVPSGATSISSIYIFYKNSTPNSNLRLWFNTSIGIEGSADSIDTTDSETTYTTPNGTTNATEKITVPSGAYNGLSITAGARFGIRIVREGASASDTFNTSWFITGIQINFA